MKSFLVAAALAGAALAQTNLSGLPDCAKSCVNLNSLGGCKQLDIKCICSSKAFIDGISCCVSKSCKDKKDQDDTIKFAQGICSPAGVTNLPTTATCAGGAASTPASSGGSSSGSSASMTSGGSSSMATGSMSSGSGGSMATTTGSSSAASGSSTPAASSPGAAGHVVAHGAAAMGGMVLAAFL